MFTVSVKYNGQPERDAGDYPTRQQAAHAAALAAGIVGEPGRRRSRWASMSPAPIGVVYAAAGHDCRPV